MSDPLAAEQREEGDNDEESGDDTWDWNRVGPSFGVAGYAFGEEGFQEHHTTILRNEGYALTRVLAMEADNLYDNQIWIVNDIESGVSCALKVASLKYYEREYLDDSVEALLKEYETLILLNHENIVKVIKGFSLEEPDTGFQWSFHCTVMELMSGTLQDLANKNPDGILAEVDAKQWFRQIANAVCYLNFGIDGGIWVSHLAIRPVNILYRVLDDINRLYTFKLTDFEESIIFQMGEVDALPMWRDFRSNAWSAPEFRAFQLGYPTRPMDIYSLGDTLFTTALGLAPDIPRKFLQFFQRKITANDMNEREREVILALSPEISYLMVVMKARNPTTRPNIMGVLSDPWLRE